MANKSGETKQKEEGNPLTDKDLANVSGGIIIQKVTNIRTTDPSDPNLGWTPPSEPGLPTSR